MINEEACLMPSLKECKHFMPWFDALFVREQELWFGRYDAAVKTDPDTVTLLTYGRKTSVSMLKEDALCFFDIGSHRWVMILSKHCRVSWQVNTTDDDIYLRMLASIAEDELKGSRGDHNDFAITNRIKNRYSTWFEERKMKAMNEYCGIPGTRNNAEKACLYFDEKVSSEVKNTLNESYGIRGQKYAQARYLTYPIVKCDTTPPQPKLLQFNGDYTTVVWEDGSHTVVKKCADDKADDEKAILFAIVKHLCKDNGCEMDRYLNKFFEHGKIVHKED